jgi:2-isopropylmalate synthase
LPPISPGGQRIDSSVELLDTTLRDGAQTRGVTFSLQDKLSLVERLDELGIQYIEGGWPGSNPKDVEFFRAVRRLKPAQAEVVAFGSTARKDVPASRDAVLGEVLAADSETVVIFGKSWDLHVTHVLHTTKEQNLAKVAETVEYLREQGRRVIFDAEHFFDGYKADRRYALNVLHAAADAGAAPLVLCDTNGGTLTRQLTQIVRTVARSVTAPLGIHAHNDAGVATANTLAAVEAGARHVQGTINGLGERCGNVDLCEVIPDLEFKMGYRALRSSRPAAERLKGLRALSLYVYELLGLSPPSGQPYVGANAFAHKAGVHVDAMLKHPRAYEHVAPEQVGNERRFSIGELSGRAAIVHEMRRLGFDVDKDSPVVDTVLAEVKELEAQGHHLENANATLSLLILQQMGLATHPFRVEWWESHSVADGGAQAQAYARVKVRVGRQLFAHEGAGVGPVHALDVALRKALVSRFRSLKTSQLTNYKVSVVDTGTATASKVRVFIEFQDGARRWATTALSANIVEASLVALVEGYTYRLGLNGTGAPRVRAARRAG